MDPSPDCECKRIFRALLNSRSWLHPGRSLAAQAVFNNQGRGEALSGEEADRVLRYLRDDTARCYDHYEMISDEGQGIGKELARMTFRLIFIHSGDRPT